MTGTPGRTEVGLAGILLGICSFGFLFLLLERLMGPFTSQTPSLTEVLTLVGGLGLSLLALFLLRWFWLIFTLMAVLTLGTVAIQSLPAQHRPDLSALGDQKSVRFAQPRLLGAPKTGKPGHLPRVGSETGLMVLTLLVMGVWRKTAPR